MNAVMTMNFVIPAKAGIQCFYSTCSWALSRFAGRVQLAGFPLAPKVGNPLSAEAGVELTPRE